MRLQSRFFFVARPFPSSRPPFSEGDGAPRHERRANIWLGITPEEIPPSSGPEKPRPIAFCLCAVCVCVCIAYYGRFWLWSGWAGVGVRWHRGVRKGEGFSRSPVLLPPPPTCSPTAFGGGR